MSNDTPLPLAQATEAEAVQGMFGAGGPSPDDPLGAAYLWFQAVRHLDEPGALGDAQALSADETVWGDFRDIARRLKGWSIMQKVEYAHGEPHIAYVKLLHVDFAAQSFGSAPIPLDDLQWLTLIAGDPYGWFVWSISSGDYRPSPNRIRFGVD